MTRLRSCKLPTPSCQYSKVANLLCSPRPWSPKTPNPTPRLPQHGRIPREAGNLNHEIRPLFPAPSQDSPLQARQEPREAKSDMHTHPDPCTRPLHPLHLRTQLCWKLLQPPQRWPLFQLHSGTELEPESRDQARRLFRPGSPTWRSPRGGDAAGVLVRLRRDPVGARGFSRKLTKCHLASLLHPMESYPGWVGRREQGSCHPKIC